MRQVLTEAPRKGVTIVSFSLAAVLLALLLGYVLADGPGFDSFPGRTIGISLLSDIDPHYRTLLYLLLSALTILGSCALFTLTGVRPGWVRPLPLDSTSALLLACILANTAAGLLHAQTALFLSAAGLCALLLALWTWHRRASADPGAENYLLCLGLGWQGATIILWLAGLPPGPLFYGLFVVLYLLAGPLLSRLEQGGERTGGKLRALNAVGGWILCAPVALVIAIEWAYFSRGEAVQPGHALTLFAVLSVGIVALGWAVRAAPRRQAAFAALCVLLTTFIVNQYDNEILYRGYDVFHLAEVMLPLQQWDTYRSLPFLDYHPGHGLFDLFPHLVYHLLNGGDPLESVLWGDGYFNGWLMQSLYIGILYACLLRFTSVVTAFFLLWLLPVFHLMDPYNALLLLPVLNIFRLPRTRRPLAWWSLQWLLALALALWRADFGLIVAAGNVVTMAAVSWYRRDVVHLVAGTAGLALWSVLLTVVVLVFGSGEALSLFVARVKDILAIQVLAASYDRFYNSVNYLVWMQYLVVPLLGALAGGYSLARVYLRADQRHLVTHLVVIFVTAIGFALSIRMFQRHSMVEGFTRTNFFYFAPLLAFLSLRMRRGWRGPLAALLIMAAFLAMPKTLKYVEVTPWNPWRSYPVTTHQAAFPELVKSGDRLVNRATKYAAFEDFSARYLDRGQTFYDFSNAPLLYMLADVKLPNYLNETVWHTSENMQDSALGELESLRQQQRLPFVVFRQNNRRWDALDGVDNALRSYKMAEYIYANYQPCVKISKLDLWTEKGIDCRGSFKDRIVLGSPARRGTRFLAPDYLEQFIDYRHLPYIWANYDSHEDEVEQVFALTVSATESAAIELTDTSGGNCRASGCYLDLVIESAREQEVPVYFDDARQLSFTVRPGSHRYRIRISALWRWHQAVDSVGLVLRPQQALVVEDAQLVKLAAWPG
jgi:hypothetical protein